MFKSKLEQLLYKNVYYKNQDTMKMNRYVNIILLTYNIITNYQ